MNRLTGVTAPWFMGYSDELGKAMGQPWAVAPDGKTLAAVRDDGESIALWSVATGNSLGQLDGHRGKITCLAFDRTGTRLVSGSNDCTALVWRLPP